MVSWDLGEFYGVICSQFSALPSKRLSRIRVLRHTTEFASRFRCVILTHGRIPIITRAPSFDEIFARIPAFQPRRTLFSETKTFRGVSSVSLCLRHWSRKGRLCLLSTMIPVVEYKFIQNHFHPKRVNFIQNHFHPNTTFIPKPLSTQTTFI